MTGLAAAAIAAAVVAVGSSADVEGGAAGVDRGGGGGTGGGAGGYRSSNGLANVTEVLVDLMTELAHTVSPASSLHRGGNGSGPLLLSPSHLTTTTTASYLAVGGFSASSNVSDGMNGTLANLTTTPEPIPVPESPYPLWAQIMIAMILGLLILGTIIGNCLVCLSVMIVNKLQTPSNLLIVSLAVADLLVAILVMPLGATLQIYGAWMLGPSVCDMWTTTDVLLCTASILNLCMISVDRYLVITRPFQYAMKRTPKRMATMITIVWVVSAVVSIPPVFGWKSPHQPYNCYISLEIGYQIYATLCAFYLPLFVMIFVYFKIWLVTAKIAKAEARSQVGSFDRGDTLQLSRPSRDSNASQNVPNGSALLGVKGPLYNNGGGGGGGGTGGPGGAGDGSDDASLEILKAAENCDRLKKRRFTIRLPGVQRAPRITHKERKATKTLGFIMGCFTLCWLPFFILALVKAFCGEMCQVPGWLDNILWWLGYANSFLNPVIYARFNRDFRTPFKEILLCRCRGIYTRMRSESYVEQYGEADPRHSLRPPVDCTVRYNSQGQTLVHVGNGSANSQSESRV